MSRLKKRRVAGGDAVSGTTAATRADCVGGEALPSPARAITGDMMVSTTTNPNACHICLRPSFLVLASRRDPSMADNMAETYRMVGSDGARAGRGRSICVSLLSAGPGVGDARAGELLLAVVAALAAQGGTGNLGPAFTEPVRRIRKLPGFLRIAIILRCARNWVGESIGLLSFKGRGFDSLPGAPIFHPADPPAAVDGGQPGGLRCACSVALSSCSLSRSQAALRLRRHLPPLPYPSRASRWSRGSGRGQWWASPVPKTKVTRSR